MRSDSSQLSRWLIEKSQMTRAVFVTGALAMAVMVVVAAGSVVTRDAAAQNIGQRTVAGAVVNDGGTVQMGATVFLKNIKTKAIRSYTTTADGHFRFTQVSMTDDHEVWAELNGKKSAVKTVSSWDARKLYECELKLK